MTTEKFTGERLTIISDKTFEEVVAAVRSQIGQPDMAEFTQTIRKSTNFDEIAAFVQKSVSKLDLMRFMELDQGIILRRETGADGPKIVRFSIGNPLIMRLLTREVPEAGTYVPVTLMVIERPDGVVLSYDKMATSPGVAANAAALKVATLLDEKIEKLMTNAATGLSKI